MWGLFYIVSSRLPSIERPWWDFTCPAPQKQELGFQIQSLSKWIFSNRRSKGFLPVIGCEKTETRTNASLSESWHMWGWDGGEARKGPPKRQLLRRWGESRGELYLLLYPCPPTICQHSLSCTPLKHVKAHPCTSVLCIPSCKRARASSWLRVTS